MGFGRLLFGVIGLAIIAVLFTPSTLFAPDWRTPFTEALAADDCAAVDRIMTGLFFSDSELWRFENYKLGEQGKCGREKQPEIFLPGEDTPQPYIEPSAARFDVSETPARKLYAIARRLWNDRDETQFRFVRETAHLANTCWSAGPGIANPNISYEPLRFALSHPELTSEEIFRIYASLDNYCAALSIALARRIEALNANYPYPRAAARYWFLASRVYWPLSPDLRATIDAHERAFTDWYEAERTRAEKDGKLDEFYRENLGVVLAYPPAEIRIEEGYEFESLAHVCRGGASRPVEALDCARRLIAADAQGVARKYRAAAVYYYLARAERFGVLDMSDLRDDAGEISAECLDAIKALEATDFAAVTDLQTQNPYLLDDAKVEDMKVACAK